MYVYMYKFIRWFNKLIHDFRTIEKISKETNYRYITKATHLAKFVRLNYFYI